MSDLVGARTPGWLRPAAGLALLWNLYGCYEYLRTVGVVPGRDEAAVAAMPGWVTGCFALAVFAGALGSLGLLMLKRWSKILLLVSLLAVVVMDVWSFAISGVGREMGGAELGVTIAVLLVAVLLVWLAHTADRRGWLS